MPNLTHLSDLDMLEAAIAESAERPVLLFKHSRTCGISCEALDELQAHVAEQAGKAVGVSGVSYKVITVQSHRGLSDSDPAEGRTAGVEHLALPHHRGGAHARYLLRVSPLVRFFR
jgi:bacillithiol system protein YtxJ